jgi:putative endonuclease
MSWITKEKRQDAQTAIVGAPASPAQARGQLAEDCAARWLVGQGLQLVARNVRCRSGEVDLICLERGTLVFVEVRLRTNPRFGTAAESITATKRRRIIFAARWWLAGAGRAHQHRPCRFDVVLFGEADASTPEWIQGAFESE